MMSPQSGLRAGLGKRASRQRRILHNSILGYVAQPHEEPSRLQGIPNLNDRPE